METRVFLKYFVRACMLVALVDIQKLIELCVSECCFLWDNAIWNLLNSEPIVLPIIVILSESYLQNFEKKAIELALTFDITPKTFRRCVDDFHARFGSRNDAAEFLHVFDSQDAQILYIIEYENDHKKLEFLDVTMRNNLNHFYDFAESCKLAIINVQIKSRPNILPKHSYGSIQRVFITCTANLFRKLFSLRNRIFKKRFCRKWI